MGNFSKDRQGAAFYTTDRRSPTAFTVSTMSSPPNGMLCTGLSFSFAANQDVTILSVQIPSTLQCLTGHSPDDPVFAEFLL
jgi:hypothetical protein